MENGFDLSIVPAFISAIEAGMITAGAFIIYRTTISMIDSSSQNQSQSEFRSYSEIFSLIIGGFCLIFPFFTNVLTELFGYRGGLNLLGQTGNTTPDFYSNVQNGLLLIGQIFGVIAICSGLILAAKLNNPNAPMGLGWRVLWMILFGTGLLILPLYSNDNLFNVFIN